MADETHALRMSEFFGASWRHLSDKDLIRCMGLLRAEQKRRQIIEDVETWTSDEESGELAAASLRGHKPQLRWVKSK